MEALFNGASSQQRLNNDAAVTGTSPGSLGMDIVTMGARVSGSLYANVKIAELFIYSSEISGTDYTNLRNYINARYSLW